MKVKWAKGRTVWHAYVYLTGHETRGGVCSATGSKAPPIDSPQLMDSPTDPGTDKICDDCRLGVLGMRKRYKEIP